MIRGGESESRFILPPVDCVIVCFYRVFFSLLAKINQDLGSHTKTTSGFLVLGASSRLELGALAPALVFFLGFAFGTLAFGTLGAPSLLLERP